MFNVSAVLGSACLLCILALAFEASAVDREDQPPPEASPRSGDFDLQGFIDGELMAGKHSVLVPPGRYRVAPRHGRHLFFKDLSDVEIRAAGVEMVCPETTQAIGLENCRNFHLSGLTIDYDPLPFTEGRITGMAPDKSWLEFELFGGYPDGDLEERVEIYDPATRELRRGDAGWGRFESLGGRRYRIPKRPGYRYDEKSDLEQIGDVLVTNHVHAPGGNAGHAVVASNCTGLKLEDVVLYASNCFGFLENRCDGSTYLRCKIDRRSPESDPVKRAFPRMRSLDADAYHSVEATRGPAIVDCTAKFQGDDCVNIHGTYHMIFASAEATLRIASERGLDFAEGDPVEFLPFEGARPPNAVVAGIAPDAPLDSEEIQFVSKLRMNDHNREALAGGKAHVFKVTLDRPVTLPRGSLVCSGRRVGNGFLVKGCDFGFNRSRGILIKASEGQVIGNRITHSGMAAVLVSPEFWWFEAASSSDVEIRDNIVDGCRRTAVEVVAPGGAGKPLPAGAHRNITIAGNIITDSPWPNVEATSTAGLRVEGNHFTPANSDGSPPALGRSWNWGAGKPGPLAISDCEDVRLDESR